MSGCVSGFHGPFEGIDTQAHFIHCDTDGLNQTINEGLHSVKLIL